MSSKVAFTINEINGAASSIPIPNENNILDNIVQSLRVGNFKTTRSYKADFTDAVNSLLAEVTFVGKGFAFGLSNTKLSSQFLTLREFMLFDIGQQVKKEKPSKLFAGKNLDQISSDFNYILGLIIGKLNLNNKDYEFNFHINVSKEISTMHDLHYLLTPESKIIFGEATSLRLKDVSISINENLFDTEVQSTYQLQQHESPAQKYFFSVESSFKLTQSGPVDFSKLVRESINRINNLVGNILEGANEFES